jgi:DNA-binding GntR family transcriptional regulator
MQTGTAKNTPPSTSTLRPQLTRRIVLSIFAGELKGGDRLVEEELALKLGVSRTPIREALSELAALQLIRLKPNHGAIVRPFGPQQLIEIYQIRRVLEAEAARAAAPNIDAIALRQIREKTQSMMTDTNRGDAFSQDALNLDGQFHELIARASGSERLTEEITRYWMLARSIGEAVGNAAHTQDRAMDEHTRIMDALLARNGVEAAHAMSDHLDRSAEAALATLYQ